MLFITIHFSAGWYSFLTPRRRLDAKFAAATLCGLDLLAICSSADKRVKRAQKNAPQLVARAKSVIRAKENVVISIFKRQRFRLLDRDHARIGFAGNDRHDRSHDGH
jgi:hypothetical protein